MVLLLHQFQSLMRHLVVECQRLFIADIHMVGKALFQLYESYNTIVDESDKLRAYAFSHQRALFYFQTAYAFCFDKQLVGEGRGAQDAP